MQKSTLNICIGGSAGQGLVTIGQILGKVIVRSGYYLHCSQVYESRVRGGHNSFSLRIGNVPLSAPSEKIDILVALDQESISVHTPDLMSDSIIMSTDNIYSDFAHHMKIPLAEMGKGARLNTIMLGTLGVLLNLSIEQLKLAFSQYLDKKDPSVNKENEAVLERAYVWGSKQKHLTHILPNPAFKFGTQAMLNGNEAIALGAMTAGLKFCSFYPMSPSTSIPLTIADNAERMGIAVEQAEDEIAAINMAIGASFAGAKSMVATSGGGMALMSEGVSLAAMMEVPVVIIIAMRPGPATGLPASTEQGDLNLALYSGHGEFPRAIFAPGSLQKCFDLTQQAFTLAEQTQGPVFILTDQYLADSYRNCSPFALEPPPFILPVATDDPHYERYVITDNGISPRRIPGFGNALVIADSDEHDAMGHISEDKHIRNQMQEKRMKKLDILRDMVVAPTFTGVNSPDLMLVCWGSTVGAVEEAASLLRKEGQTVGVCHFSQVYPMRPDSFLTQFAKSKQVVVVESNSAGQLSALLRIEADFAIQHKILRYDGLAMTAWHIVDQYVPTTGEGKYHA